MVEIITQPDGWSAEEVERYVTVPLEIGLAGHARSRSHPLAVAVRPLRREVLLHVGHRLPATRGRRSSTACSSSSCRRGCSRSSRRGTPSARSSATRVVGKGYSLADLKTAQDWILERQFRQVPGVIDVVGFGGETKQYHVEVDPYRLQGAGPDARRSSSTRSRNAQPERRRAAHHARRAVVQRPRHRPHPDRCTTSATSWSPSRRACRCACATSRRVPVGAAPRLGIVGKDDEPDIVQGVVLMRYGGDSLKTLEGVHERVDYIRKLPPLAAGHGHRALLRSRRSW